MRLVSSTLVPSTERTEILWSPSRVHHRHLAVGRKCDAARARSCIAEIDLSGGGECLARDGEDRDRSFVTIGDQSERPDAIDRNAGRSETSLERRDHCRRLALRSITESRLSGTSFFGSAGSSFMLEDISAIDSRVRSPRFAVDPPRSTAPQFTDHLGRRDAEIDDGHGIVGGVRRAPCSRH